ncbi:MAG: ATP-binding protein [Alphaproteobacteria bacterium]|nr:ATP-binding protein [Alphaproteobacteria bacterium]
MPKLYITHGFTGSGKSTFARKFCNENKIIKLSHDEVMITVFGNNPPMDKFQKMNKSISTVIENLASEILQKGYDVLLDIAGFKRESRDAWKQVADRNNAEFVILHVKVSKDVALQRTLKRTESEQGDAFFINENGFNVINSRLEPLGDDEAAIVIDGENF